MTKNGSDKFSYVIGSLILGFLAWQLIAYILPDRPTNYTGETLLIAIMNEHGGKANWENVKRMTYSKAYTLFNEDNSIDKDRKEKHSYTFDSGYNRLIQWKEQNILYNLVATDKEIYQTRNTEIDTTISDKQLRSKLNAATFVIGLPYTLDSQEAMLEYEGVGTFLDTNSHILKVTFNGSEDIWRLYYDQDSLDWLGYWVKTSDHYSLIQNEEMIEVNGFTLSRKRKSYRTDSLKNILYLRATYEYSNYHID